MKPGIAILTTLVIATLLLMNNITLAQTKGDEDAQMFNSARTRDSLAIKNAVNGWWTVSMKDHEQRIAWWRKAKFGMFIHWGVYSLPAGEWKGKKVSGYAEHLMRKEKITRNEYLEVAHKFNPVKFNADEWVKNAKKAGMRYMIITSKHHDGFAMYPSAVSDFNISKQTPFKQDPMALLSAACKKYGIKFGFYYSHAFDWEHPGAPGNDWEYKNPGGDLGLFGGANWYDVHPELLPKAQKYVDEKAIPQIKELLTKYHPDILWFDTPSKLPLSENIRILKAIRETDNKVVINGRLVRSAGANFGDYKNTADRPAEFYPVSGDWEAIPTTNESYGYSKYDSSHKPVSHFIQLIASAASRGGNLLMNLGPKGDGTFDKPDLDILNGIGRWMDKNSESIYGTTAGSLPLQSWGVATQKNNRLYLHVFNRPADGKLLVGGLKSAPSSVAFLTTKQPLKAVRLNEMDLVIDIPKKALDTINTVIVLDFKNKIVADSIRFVSTVTPLTRLLAFDAVQHGKGFGFGDGKKDRYYVDGWKTKEQWLSFTFRTAVPAAFKMVIKYLGADTAGSTYSLTLDRFKTEKQVAVQKQNKVITEELGQVQVEAGSHEINIKPVNINTELMKLLEVQLIPIK